MSGANFPRATELPSRARDQKFKAGAAYISKRRYIHCGLVWLSWQA
jgi:hypothetical protein